MDFKVRVRALIIERKGIWPLARQHSLMLLTFSHPNVPMSVGVLSC